MRPVMNATATPRLPGQHWRDAGIDHLARRPADRDRPVRGPQRRAVHGGGDPAPVEHEIVEDGIAEFFDVFVATGFAFGLVPPAQATLVLEATDTGARRVQHLPDPCPATTVRGTASDLLLAVWRRRDPLAHHVGGPRGVLESWPSI
jgi:hypothetical protein